MIALRNSWPTSTIHTIEFALDLFKTLAVKHPSVGVHLEIFVIHKAMPMLALLVSLGKPFLEAPLWKVSNVASGGGVAPAKSYEINRLYYKTQGM